MPLVRRPAGDPQHYLEVRDDSDNRYVERYDTEDEAKAALRQFIEDVAGSSALKIVVSRAGGIAIKQTHFKSARVGVHQPEVVTWVV